MRVALLAFLILGLIGCDKPADRVAALPAAPTAPPATPAPTPPSGPMLSGMVFESTPEGTRPLPDSQVWLVVGDTTTSVMTDKAGRYSMANPPSPDRRRMLALPPVGLQLFQRTPAMMSANGDATVDIELVSEGTRGAAYTSPTLSGIVYYMAREGPRPYPHTRVVYKAFEGPWYDVYQTSDALGRYDFGRLPLGSGQLGAGDCHDQMQFRPIDIRGDTIADFDITWLVTNCPGIPF